MNRHLAPIRHVLFFLLIAVALLVPAPSLAQGAVTLTAAPAFEGNYTPGTWLPVTMRLSNAGPAVEATVAAALPESLFRNTQIVELPTGADKSLTLYVAMEQAVREIRLTVEADGAVLAEQALAVRPRPDERMLALLATEDPRLNLPRRQDLATLPFTVVNLTPGTLPERAEGLSSLSLLLLSGVPGEALSPAQAAALLGWVDTGGHLFIGGGPTAAATLAGLPPLLQPATIGATTTVPDEPLAILAAADGPGPLQGVALTPAADARVSGRTTAPAWVTRRIGQGAVTQLAFDPGLPALAGWAAAPQFWDQLLRSPTLINTPLGQQPRADVIQEQILAGALTSLPTVNLPPANLIFAVLAFYAVLVGPGLSLLLRRFDRQAWAWVAVPALALLTGGAVFGLAFALRADQRVINQLSLVETREQGETRARTFIGVLSPQTRTFVAELPAPALVRPVRGATGVYGAVSGVRGDIVQEGPPVALNVEAWQLQGVMAESHLPPPGVSATLLVGPDGPGVELHNEGDQVLRDAVAVYGEQVAFLGDLRPGERLQALWPDQPLDEVPRGTPISFLVLGEERETGRVRDRRVLAREALINAAVARGSSGSDAGPFVMAWMERSPLAFAVDAEGAASQAMSLLVLRPDIAGSGPVALPTGWLRPDLTAGGRVPCNGELGTGIPASPTPITVTMRLPAGLSSLTAEALTLTIEGSDRWPNAGVTTELLNQDQGRWIEQDFDGPGELVVPGPAPYLRNGELLLRLTGPLETAQCLYVSAVVQGAMP